MNKSAFVSFITTLIVLSATASAAEDVCAPLGLGKSALMELRENKFELSDPDQTVELALALTGCLGSPDPDLRDKVAYEGLAYLMRQKLIQPGTIREIGTILTEYLTAADPEGFRRPFAALVLSEVARADRIDNIYSEAERGTLVKAATDYLRSVNDYRGFDEAQGWRHGVAHGADFLMQLTLNEKLSREQLLDIRDAVASQIMADNHHFYTYGEPERLARPILFIARRNIFSADEWTAWFEEITDPAPFEAWGDVFFSQSGLARRHNLRGFALSIYANADASEQDVFKSLLPGALATLRTTN